MVKLFASSSAQADAVKLTEFLRTFESCEVQGVVAIGSSTHPGLWRAEVSDIDLNLFIDEGGENLSSLCLRLTEFLDPHVTWTSRPHVWSDDLQDRVEAIFVFCDTSFDVTWASPHIRVNVGPEAVVEDRLELFIGQTYVDGILLAGERPEPPTLGRIRPYYDDTIRRQRLSAVITQLSKQHDAVYALLANRDAASATWAHATYLRYAWQAVFMAQRVYPTSYDKHAAYQIARLKNDVRVRAALLETWPRDGGELRDLHANVLELASVPQAGAADA